MWKLFILLPILFTSCMSSKKLLEKGRYDEAIEKCVKKLKHNPSKNDEARVLDKAYNISNTKDFDRIQTLKYEGNPAGWEEIYYLYVKLDKRQKLVLGALPLQLDGKSLYFDTIDYTPSIDVAKTKTSDYYFEKGQFFSKSDDMYVNRDAYYFFLKSQKYSPRRHPEIDSLIPITRYKEPVEYWFRY